MPHDDIETNHGVLIGQRATDFIAGALQYEVRNDSGDWTPYLVSFERQSFPGFDTMACVSFSANTLCEMQIKQQTGIEVNLSDRFLAKMSGTTSQGNWLYVVGDTLRNIGTVLEEDWPVPPNPTWETYYSPISQITIDKAKARFRDLYKLETEFIPVIEAEIKKHLKHAPLQIVIPGHAVAGIVLKASNNEVTYFDTYLNNNSPIKKTSISNIQSVYKLLLTVKGHTMAKVLNDGGTIRLEFGSGPQGFNIGVASKSLFDQIVASGEPILNQAATTPEKLTLSEGMIIHNK